MILDIGDGCFICHTMGVISAVYGVTEESAS